MASSSLLGTEESVENDLEDVEKFQTDMLNLYNSGECSDFTLICEKQEFKVHKAILEARCPSLSKTRYESLTADTLHHMLLYIYGDTARQEKWSVEDAMGLLTSADYYNLAGLKHEASASLCNRINIENVLETLMTADRHRASYLSSVCKRSVFISLIIFSL